MKEVKKMKKGGDIDGQGINSLSVDLLERVLSLLPLKPRTKLKCVSKVWRTAITNLRSSLIVPSSGLVIFSMLESLSRYESYPVTFLAAQDGGTCTEVKSFVIDDPIHLLLAHSQNGLLLLQDVFSPRVLLNNPALADPAAITELPSLNSLDPDDADEFEMMLNFSDRSHCGFFFDDPSSTANQNYKVVLFTMTSDCYDAGEVCCHVFSSESNKWEEHQAKILKPSSHHGSSLLISSNDFFNYAPCVCHNRKLHWLFRKFVMVYDFDHHFFQVIDLPSNLGRADIKLEFFHNHHGILWVSEGYLYYCQSAKGGLSLWTHKDDDDDGDEYDWIFKQWIPFDVAQENQDMEYSIQDDDNICPLAFNEELQMLYLHDQVSTLFFYSFETQRLSKAWSHYDKDSEATIMMGCPFPVGFFS